MSRYQELAQQFVSDIEQGRRKPGSRLPSLRQLAKQQAVSLSTAISCYQELESQGRIHARPQAGYFVSASMVSHATPEWTQFVSQISAAKPNHQLPAAFNGPLGVSSTHSEAADVIELERSFRRAVKRMGDRLNRYPDSRGELSLRTALSDHFTPLGLHFSPDEVVVTSGCMSAIKTALEACTQPGDAIAISSPCFNGILQLLGEMSRSIVEIPSLDDGIDLAQLESHFQQGVVTAAIFCTSHMNPQGITMSVKQKQALAKLANQYQIPVIEDDVYLELSHEETTPLPAKCYDTDGYVLWCGSVSKSLSPGYRLGWCLPGRYLETYQRRFSVSSYGVATPIQLAVADYIASGHYARQVKKRRQKLAQLKREYLQYLSAHLPAEVKISQPQGGMVIWLQIPALDADAFAKQAQEQRLDVRLGQLFTTLDLYQDCLRINAGYPLQDDAKAQLDTLITLIHQCRQSV
ncbi:PLP-dependent aminotransferase family protein [Vibrio cidicii]|uniref:aminotransferase-like domain-containing protein n=1 Tax=Vibrio cidicii TaxID=1763883 RepID=UPI003F5120E8